MFSSENFLRSCSICNNAKLDQFPSDPAGGRLLIEPCEDDPLDYFEWDLRTGATGLNPQPIAFYVPRGLNVLQLTGSRSKMSVV